MENLSRNLLLKIVDQISPHVVNIIHGPFFLKHENLWRIVIESSKPGSGSITFDIMQRDNDGDSDFTFVFCSSEEHCRLKVIFEKIKKMCCDLSRDVFSSKCFITFNLIINLANKQETEEFLLKTCIFFQKFFIIIRDLKLIQLNNRNTLYNRNNKIRAYNRNAFLNLKPKIIIKSQPYLIRKSKPAILPVNKTYYYQ